MALQERASERDFFDLYFILQKIDFKELLKITEKNFKYFDKFRLLEKMFRIKKLPDDIKDWRIEIVKETSAIQIKDKFYELMEKLREEIEDENKRFRL